MRLCSNDSPGGVNAWQVHCLKYECQFQNADVWLGAKIGDKYKDNWSDHNALQGLTLVKSHRYTA